MRNVIVLLVAVLFLGISGCAQAGSSETTADGSPDLLSGEVPCAPALLEGVQGLWDYNGIEWSKVDDVSLDLLGSDILGTGCFFETVITMPSGEIGTTRWAFFPGGEILAGAIKDRIEAAGVQNHEDPFRGDGGGAWFFSVNAEGILPGPTSIYWLEDERAGQLLVGMDAAELPLPLVAVLWTSVD